MADNKAQDIMKVLDYSIHSYSSFSPNFVPENIKEDKRNDQLSRWSSDSNFPPQYLVLKLDRPAIVKTITFGKFEKTHVCNLKKFKIFGGLDENTTIELLDWGLKNDSVSETFDLKHTLGDAEFPCSYIRIEPFQSWGHSFNFSIWFVELYGYNESARVKKAARWLEQYRDLEITKLCMKHFRQKNYMGIYDMLQTATGVSLEHPLLTQLFNVLVNEGDYEQVEQLMTSAIHNNYLDWYISQQDYRPSWSPVITQGPIRPGMRGGHQMTWDPQTEIIYLLGGWDGTQDLSDFWSYSIREGRWTLICPNVEYVGGPTPRSCHKLCLDPERRQIFVLGRYLDQQLRQPEFLKSDFFLYDIDSNTWTLISWDTAAVGGPRLIFDHQMCLDSKQSKIYVFGGRVLTPSCGQSEERMISSNSSVGSAHSNNNNLTPPLSISVSLPAPAGGALPSSPSNMASHPPSHPITVGVSYEQVFSGLYAYHIPTSTWEQIIPDSNYTHARHPVKSRAGHSMLFHPELRKLYIFAGQRNKEYLNDFIAYNVDTHEVENIQDNVKHPQSRDNLTGPTPGTGSNQGLPASGFTRRATIDPVLNEIYVLSGLSKEKEKREETVQNSFWIYQMNKNQWSCVYKNENSGENYWNKMSHVEPCPRFAHQLVYDSVNKIHYLFGGNPGKACSPRLRLDDFWSLQLARPTRDQVLTKLRIAVRTAKYQELSLSNKFAALGYLQTSLHDLINHEDKDQRIEFQSLTQHLFNASPSPPSSPPSSSTQLLSSSSDVKREPHPADARLAASISSTFDWCQANCRSVESNMYLCEQKYQPPEESNSRPATVQPKDSLSSDITNRRTQLYRELTTYFPASMTPPKQNLQDIVRF